MSIKAPEGYISAFIGNGKVTHCIRKGVNGTLCGKDAERISQRDAGIACKVCAARVEAMTEVPAATTDSTETPEQQPDTPAARQARITEKVNELIEKVRASLKAGDEESAQQATNEADRLMAPLPPAMRGMLRGSLMEAKQTEPDPAATPAEDTDESDEETNEHAQVAIRDETTEGDNESEEQSPEANQPNDADNSAEAMAKLITTGATLVSKAIRTRVTGNKAIAQVLLDMRTRIKDKDGDIDLRSATDEAKKNSSSMYQLVEDTIKEHQPDHADYLLSEMESIRRGVQTAMRDEVVGYVRSLDVSPEEFAKYERAREEFPELSPSEAVWAYYEKVGKPLPRQTRAEVARMKRALKNEGKARVNPKEDEAREPKTETQTDDAGQGDADEVSQHDEDVKTLKRAARLVAAIAERAKAGAAEERAEIKQLIEALAGTANEESAPL